MPDPSYSARAHVSGGRREGHGRTSDGKLEVDLDLPTELGGKGAGTNPEQLFAVGYAACFLEALKSVGRERKQRVDAADIDSEVHLVRGDDGFRLAAVLRVHVPGMDRAQAQELVEAAHETCPYSRATRGNMDVDLQVADERVAA